MLDQATPTSTSESHATPAAPAAQTPARRRGRGSAKQQQGSPAFLFALGSEELGKHGLPTLTECFTVEGDAMVAAFKGGVDYYKLQRCKVALTVDGGAVTITSSVAEQPAMK